MTGMQERSTLGTGQGTRINGRVLAVGASDSCGGSGVQADIKAITALGGYAMTAITTLTAQNTQGVNGTVDTTGGFVAKQMRMALKDIGADVVKIGLLVNEEIAETVHYTYREFAPDAPIVLDPVMMSKTGESLVHRETVHLIRQHFLLHATITTPNIYEAEILTGMEIHSLNDMKRAAELMVTLGCQGVLITGGHFEGDSLYDVIFTEDGLEVLEEKIIDTPHTHGSGCTLASAIATGLAQGMTMTDAVARARQYVRNAILTAPGFGKGTGPMNHVHTVAPFHPEG